MAKSGLFEADGPAVVCFLQDPPIFGENALRMVEFVYWQANHDREIPIHFSLRLMLETDVSLLPRGVSRKHINSKKSLNANFVPIFCPEWSARAVSRASFYGANPGKSLAPQAGEPYIMLFHRLLCACKYSAALLENRLHPRALGALKRHWKAVLHLPRSGAGEAPMDSLRPPFLWLFPH